MEVKTRHVEGVCSTCKTMTTCFSSGVWSVFFAVLHANSSSMIVPEKSNIFFMIRVRFHVVKRHVFCAALHLWDGSSRRFGRLYHFDNYLFLFSKNA